MSTNRYFSCPYCNDRLTRDDMVEHIEKKHLELLPPGFSPLRMTFHIVNKKDIKYTRPCRICKGRTKWDESKGRYNFICENNSCKDAYSKKMFEDMGDRRGINRQTQTIEGLEKMLANRKISGTYKFKDGGEKTYTGSYERKALEFMDDVLNLRSEDIECPGPIMNYILDGKEHIYIPDMYYIPYQLVIEVKDGGNRPNKHDKYIETRKRQIAKEEHVIKNTNYNYLRLTDNDFSQLLSVFMELKLALYDFDNDGRTKRVINVNENMFPAMQGFMLPPTKFNADKDIVIVNYLMRNNLTGESEFAVADNPKFDTVFARDPEGNLKEATKDLFINSNYTPYIVKNIKESVEKKINQNIDSFVSPDFIYESVFDHKYYSEDQIQYESGAEEYGDFYNEMNSITESTINNLSGGKQ